MFCGKGINFPYLQSSWTNTFGKYNKNELLEYLQKSTQRHKKYKSIFKRLRSIDHTLGCSENIKLWYHFCTYGGPHFDYSSSTGYFENFLYISNMYIHIHVFYFLFTYFSFLLWPHLQHMEVPRLGVELELQLPAYAIATATLGSKPYLRPTP